MKRHSHEGAEALLSQFLDALPCIVPSARDGILAIGYCFGGKHLLRLAGSRIVAGAAFHPVRKMTALCPFLWLISAYRVMLNRQISRVPKYLYLLAAGKRIRWSHLR